VAVIIVCPTGTEADYLENRLADTLEAVPSALSKVAPELAISIRAPVVVEVTE
jgi:hypothetical protein